MIVKNTKEYFVGFLSRIKNKGEEMELKEMIKVMQHYENGGEVEYSEKNGGGNHWTTVTSPSWNWVDCDYRIIEPKQKVTIEKWLCRDYHGNFIVIETTGIDEYYYEKVKLIKSYEVEL